MTQPNEQPKPDPFTAVVALQAAIDQLTQPGTVELDRDIPVAPRPGEQASTAYQLAADDRALEEHLAERARTAAATNDWDTWERTLVDLAQLGRRRDARTSTTAPLPSLLEQLADAVESSGGGAGGPAAAASRRSPIGLDAADLLRRIQTTTSSPTTWPGPLTEHVRAWGRRSSTQDHQTITAAAQDAQAWADTARDLLTPHRRMQLVRPCPACGQRHARTTTDGETTITAALQLDLTDKIARCLRCGTTWREHQFDLLAKVLDQTDDDTEPRR